ncbi:MAG: SgcJ/EcaC family oxidoreductase [Gemmatimonadota bacterium]|nr:MAG: SgcJ/EcaC family oxidoreductase [Gemmatimonadota bacterium]
MKARSVLLAVLSLALVTLACQPPAAEMAQLSDEDKAAIQNLVDELVQAELAGDWEVVFGMYTEDVVDMPPNRPAREGLATLREWVESQDFTVSELTATVADIDGRGDLAYVRGTYSETFAMGGGEPIEDQRKFVLILKKQADGNWRIAIGISNSDLPLPEEGAET